MIIKFKNLFIYYDFAEANFNKYVSEDFLNTTKF
jgi:hypothetical protein